MPRVSNKLHIRTALELIEAASLCEATEKHTQTIYKRSAYAAVVASGE
jgi:hypothetical protein